MFKGQPPPLLLQDLVSTIFLPVRPYMSMRHSCVLVIRTSDFVTSVYWPVEQPQRMFSSSAIRPDSSLDYELGGDILHL